jgi:aryl-alcohol dehydrogenase-like predicted oxidoreductase
VVLEREQKERHLKERQSALNQMHLQRCVTAEDTKENDFQIIDRVHEIAQKKKISSAQVSLAWLLSKPYVTAPIIGVCGSCVCFVVVTKMQHLEEAVAALNVKLTDEEIKYLEELYIPHNVAGGFLNLSDGCDFIQIFCVKFL